MQRKAVVTTGPKTVEVKSVPLPEPGAGQIIVQVAAVGLNPTDWKSLDGVTAVGSIIGVDFAGTVMKLGPGVDTVKVGDRFAGFVHGSVANAHRYGAFATEIIAFPDLGMVLPDDFSFESGAILGVGITTVGQALRQTLKIPDPVPFKKEGENGEFILVYGGTTATGMLAIQFAVLSGMRVITCASEKQFDKVKELGAEATFDYHNKDCASQIREYTGGKLKLAFDCISQTSSYQICVDAIASTGGTITGVLPPKDDLKDRREDVVKLTPVLSYTAVGESFQKGDKSKMQEVSKSDRTESAEWWKLAAQVVSSGKLSLNEITLMDGGLEGISDGLAEGRSGSNGAGKGGKMVYKL